MQIKVNKVYRHYKGKLVKVLCLGLNSESKEEMVAIEELEESQGYPKGQVWFRNSSDFFDKINDSKFNQKYRFEEINKED